MGYSHYLRNANHLGTKEQFSAFAQDCKRIFDYCQNELSIKLADGFGEIGSEPLANEEMVWFNGAEDQPVGEWTTSEDISIPWPSDTASVLDAAEPVAGTWYAGTLVSKRIAPIDNLTGKGSGSYETMLIERISETGRETCKTGYRPYDLAVTAVLIACKHHFPHVEVDSDGKEKDWLDGRILCNNILGYGLGVTLDIK